MLLSLRVTPNAGRDAVDGVERRDDGSSALRLRVKAVPDKGRANQAVLALLAKLLGVPKSALAITAGETARTKSVLVEGKDEVVIARLQALLSPS